MSRSESSCAVKRDVVVPLAVAGAFILSLLGFLAVSNTINSFMEMSIVLTVFVLLAFVHEIIHYLTLKLLGKRVKMWILTRYGALVVDYLDELTWSELIYTYLTPQALITLPLLLTYVTTRYVFTYALLMLHLAASMPDLLNTLRILAVFRNSKFELCREGRKIVGFKVTKPNGDCTVYKLI